MRVYQWVIIAFDFTSWTHSKVILPDQLILEFETDYEYRTRNVTIEMRQGSAAYCDGDVPVCNDEVWRHVVQSATTEQRMVASPFWKETSVLR
jgi:hypothetical protein